MLEALADFVAALPGGERLLAPIDGNRPHDLSFAAKLHGRVMVLAWAFIVPVGVLIARFTKITPKQDWPNHLDNRFWFHTHWVMQSIGALGMVVGLYLIWKPAGEGWAIFLHRSLGWSITVFCALQVVAGIFRGSRGGPDHPAPDGSWAGDHYDMTMHRRVFERMHKSVGYIALSLSCASVFSGLWIANGPLWMWITLALWYPTLIVIFTVLQRRGLAVDTYQAIWGPDPTLPGNQIKPIGWGVTRCLPPEGYRGRRSGEEIT